MFADIREVGAHFGLTEISYMKEGEKRCVTTGLFASWESLEKIRDKLFEKNAQIKELKEENEYLRKITQENFQRYLEGMNYGYP